MRTFFKSHFGKWGKIWDFRLFQKGNIFFYGSNVSRLSVPFSATLCLKKVTWREFHHVWHKRSLMNNWLGRESGQTHVNYNFTGLWSQRTAMQYFYFIKSNSGDMRKVQSLWGHLYKMSVVFKRFYFFLESEDIFDRCGHFQGWRHYLKVFCCMCFRERGH